ncbi:MULTISPECIES: helix-turn-helix domain-containing protein [Proteus]|uniref:helix-turn-helix domain-containing protein n=2 Tax=Morganellaceae TaxID=1903414 RepID=UPI0021005DB0|nr:helix-turn-helix domain-containing protein [Proteus penneri]
MREQNNIPQSSLALILNMTKESVSKWERNKIKPNGATLRRVNLIAQKVTYNLIHSIFRAYIIQALFLE